MATCELLLPGTRLPRSHAYMMLTDLPEYCTRIIRALWPQHNTPSWLIPSISYTTPFTAVSPLHGTFSLCVKPSTFCSCTFPATELPKSSSSACTYRTHHQFSPVRTAYLLDLRTLLPFSSCPIRPSQKSDYHTTSKVLNNGHGG